MPHTGADIPVTPPSDHIRGFLSKPLINHDPSYKTFGTISMGLDVCDLVWPKLHQAFRMDNQNLQESFPTMKQSHFLGPCERAPPFALHTHSVDLLLIGASEFTKQQPWQKLVANCTDLSCPCLILEFWKPREIMTDDGPMAKSTLVQWASLGYHSHVKLVNSTCVGGSIDQLRLIVARVYKGVKEGWTWPEMPTSVCRPMSNCLRTHGIPHKAYRTGPSTAWVPSAVLDPMPENPGSLITTDKGTRKLLNDKLAYGLGIPKTWLAQTYPNGRALKNTTSLHILEYLTPILSCSQAPTVPSSPSPSPSRIPVPNDPTDPELEPSIFDWKPPKLDITGAWYRTRLSHLQTASSSFDDAEAVVKEGIEMLKEHRGNYTDTHPEPTHLRILWWEFPPEHWLALKEGSSMNFLTEPEHQIQPNADMTPEQLDIAANFVNELLDLGVMVEGDIKTNAPLFVLPKDGQPDEWRVLADMKLGGQNAHIGSDPTVFPKSGVILYQLYSGGYSAVIDASKFFYQFTTLPSERPYLGCVHPTDGRHLYYRGLPMGSGNSPSIAGRFGAAFLRLLRENCSAFQGTPGTNTWWDAFASDQPLDGSLSHGRTLMGKDGLPAVLAWAHCDDFLIHGPNKAKTELALRQFLDLAVDVGMLCHPGKLQPPAQVVKYTGFIFDTTHEPALRIPEAKREKSLAMLDYVLQHRAPLSRLTLAVVAGVLESVSDATPGRLGHTYLKSLYQTIHPAGWEGIPYYSLTVLSEENRQDLLWWRQALISDSYRRSRGSKAGTLIPTFGDGSDTGTGGTLHLPNAPLQMWMGAWSPQIFHHSSNWKELRTLLATLQYAEQQACAVTGSTFLYFTDNLVTYYIVSSGASSSPELHRLIVEIKRLELVLGCHLEVVHVPGTTLIHQGTDGLSRGVWCSPLHRNPEQRGILAEIFAPVPFNSTLGDWACMQANIPWPFQWKFRDWRKSWNARLIIDQLTVWFPPPEVAAQLIYALLQAYVERPMTTSILIVVPRILQKKWARASRHVLEVGVFPRADLPTLHSSPILIPVVLLYVPPHQRSLPDPRLVTAAASADKKWHEHQAALMRGLPIPSLSSYSPA